VLVGADRVELLSGEPQAVDVLRTDGSPLRISRCRTCQIAVDSQYGSPKVLFVRGGTLDGPASVECPPASSG